MNICVIHTNMSQTITEYRDVNKWVGIFILWGGLTIASWILLGIYKNTIMLPMAIMFTLILIICTILYIVSIYKKDSSIEYINQNDTDIEMAKATIDSVQHPSLPAGLATLAAYECASNRANSAFDGGVQPFYVQTHPSDTQLNIQSNAYYYIPPTDLLTPVYIQTYRG